jgi:two-component system, NtrC family, response regulator HydG
MAASGCKPLGFVGRSAKPQVGTRFGNRRGMPTPRQRDRREALTELFIALSRALDRQSDVSLMRGAFEQMVGRLVPVRTIQLREAGSRWSGPIEAGVGTESIALEVPGADPATKGVLEASFDPACCLGEWDFQMLGLAAHIGALVLEIERGRLQLARASSPDGQRVRRDRAPSLIGSTPLMHALRSRIDRVAATDFTVLLEGETGVGKELVARQIHESSRRRHGPFVAVNCAALVETLLEAELFGIEERTATGVRGRRGKFEHAEGGTLFLDEVSDLSPSAQAKLLRVIQNLSVERVGGAGTHRVDIRVVAATNRSLASMVEHRLFRADLFYRLSGVDIQIPALRERRGDVPALAQHFLDAHRSLRRVRLSAAAMDALVSYDWPGNVRELERLIERAVALTDRDTIEPDDLPAAVRGDFSAAILPSLKHNDTLRVWAGRYSRLILERCQGNKREACRVLGISYHTLQAYVRLRSSPADGEQPVDMADDAPVGMPNDADTGPEGPETGDALCVGGAVEADV